MYAAMVRTDRNTLVPVAAVNNLHLVFAVHNGLPVQDLRGLIEHARARPGDVNFASSGPGSMFHLSTEVLEKARLGLYSHFEVQRGLGVSQMLNFFEETAQGWQARTGISFAVMGAAYSRIVNGFDKPLGRLLNIGTEEIKGTERLQETAAAFGLDGERVELRDPVGLVEDHRRERHGLGLRGLGEMAVAYPAIGGFYEYSRLSMGNLAGFLTGWMYWYFWVIVVGFEAVVGSGSGSGSSRRSRDGHIG